MIDKAKEYEEILTDAHALALDQSHLMVPFSKDQLVMANRVIANLEKKLLNIAELIQVALGD